MQAGAGVQSSLPDLEYAEAGAEVVPSAEEVWAHSDLIVKVKEPQPSEYPLFRPGLILFTYLHLAPLPELTQKLCDSGVSSVAYETIRESDGSLPLLTPMSEVARPRHRTAQSQPHDRRVPRDVRAGGVAGSRGRSGGPRLCLDVLRRPLGGRRRSGPGRRRGRRARRHGLPQISLGDTIGVATPRQVLAVLGLLAARGVGTEVLAVHFHDTYGQALANTLSHFKPASPPSTRVQVASVGAPTRRARPETSRPRICVWHSTGSASRPVWI